MNSQVLEETKEPPSKDVSGKRGAVAATAPTREDVLKRVKYEWGPLNVELFLKKLMQDGITDVQVEQKSAKCVNIVLVGEDTQIRMEEGTTHIVCGGKQSLRLKLRDLLMQCVQKF